MDRIGFRAGTSCVGWNLDLRVLGLRVKGASMEPTLSSYFSNFLGGQ